MRKKPLEKIASGYSYSGFAVAAGFRWVEKQENVSIATSRLRTRVVKD